MNRLKKLCTILLYKFVPPRLLINLKKLYYPYIISDNKTIEEIDARLLEMVVSKGNTVVDIGANIGVYTVHLSRLVGDTGSVYSIEPVDVTYDILTSNIHKLDLTNVIPLNYALSNQNQVVQMGIPSSKEGVSNYYRAEIVDSLNIDDQITLVNVDTRRLDDIFADFDQSIAFIKCDVEGHEMACIEGGLETMRKHKPIWLIEIDGNTADNQARDLSSPVFDFLDAEGYSVFRFDGVSLNRPTNNDYSVNYWFLKSQHITELLNMGISIEGEKV